MNARSIIIKEVCKAQTCCDDNSDVTFLAAFVAIVPRNARLVLSIEYLPLKTAFDSYSPVQQIGSIHSHILLFC